MKKRREAFGKIGLVLSGGAGKSLFHVGALSTIVKHGIDFSYIAAVSGGGIAAAKLLEVLPDIDELEKAALIKFKNPPFFTNRELFRHPLRAKSLLDNSPLKALVRELDMNKVLNSPVEFHVVTVNFLTGKEYKFSNRDNSSHAMPLALNAQAESEILITAADSETMFKALIASTALPGIFKPEIINGEAFIDGGMLNPLPIGSAILRDCDTVIVIETNPEEDVISPAHYAKMGWFEILARGYGLQGKRLVQQGIINTGRINKNINALAKLKINVMRTADNEEKRNEIRSIFAAARFDFGHHKKVKLILSRPHSPLLISSLRWQFDDAKKIIAESKKNVEEQLKKACLI